MKKILVYSLLFILLSACDADSSNDTTETNQTDSVETNLIDTTSAESFIQSICNFRKEKESTTPGFEIKGTCILNGPKGFKLFNFNEGFEDYNLNTNYAIALNQHDPKTEIQSGKDVYTQLIDLLTENKLPFAIYEGNFEKTLDLKYPSGSKI